MGLGQLTNRLDMKANCSPGPWKANNITANHWTVEADSPHVKGKWQTVCDINGPWDAKNYKANALLIAAAPTMLSALQTALACLYNLQSEQRWDKEEGDHIEEAFDAIETINLAILKATS